MDIVHNCFQKKKKDSQELGRHNGSVCVLVHMHVCG